MCPTSASVGPSPVPFTRASTEPSASEETSANASPARRKAAAASRSWPEGPGVVNNSLSSPGKGTAQDATCLTARPKTPSGSFSFAMTTTITTDLLTPLGAYLRLREHERASFLLESVEQGRLGRYSFVGAGSRLVYLNEAEALGLPVVGYVGYEHAAKLEPTVPVPSEGPSLPETRFLVADTLVRFDHANGVVDVLYGDGTAL